MRKTLRIVLGPATTLLLQYVGLKLHTVLNNSVDPGAILVSLIREPPFLLYCFLAIVIGFYITSSKRLQELDWKICVGIIVAALTEFAFAIYTIK